MGGMVANAAMLGARVERVGREKFMVKDGEVTGLVDRRIMIKGSGGEVATVLGPIGGIDMRGLKGFGG